MTADRSPHDEADDRLTRYCAALGHPPWKPTDRRCICGEWPTPVRDRYLTREDTP